LIYLYWDAIRRAFRGQKPSSEPDNRPKQSNNG
jgi:hypothetical protein